MKYLIQNLCIVVVMSIAFVSCLSTTKRADGFVQSVAQVSTEPDVVAEYLSDSSFIDLEIVTVLQKVAAPKGVEIIEADVAARLKAALYRYLSHVELVDGKYNCSLSSGDQINVSDRIFRCLQISLEKMNDYIDEQKEDGKDILIPEMNEEYLKILL